MRTLEIGVLARFEAGRSHPGLFIPLGESQSTIVSPPLLPRGVPAGYDGD